MNQKLQDYIESSVLNFSLADSSRFSDSREPLADRLFRILTRADIRAAKLSDEMKLMLQTKIKNSIKEQQPITIAYGMGGTRGYNTVNFPSINWAEVFQLSFMYEQLNIISQIYEPGVVIEYSTDDYGVDLINNYKQEWIEQYRIDWGNLIKYYDEKTHKNFVIRLKTGKDFIPDKQKLNQQVREEAEKIKQDKAQVEELIKVWLPRALNNVYIEGEVSEEKKKELAIDSLITNIAWLTVDEREYRHEYWSLTEGINIPVVNFADFPGFVIHTIKGSTVQFWKGNGLFGYKNDRYYPMILSRGKWDEVKNNINNETIDNEFVKAFPMLKEAPVLKSL